MDKILELREKTNKLPLKPGVYLMKDSFGEIIYIGKAKALKNRVSSYFTGEHLPKVAAMISHVDDFEIIIVDSEFEALVLENNLIKRYKPHYNILLKDDKTYPMIRLDMRDKYPTFSLVNKSKNDGALYFGPYGSRGLTKSILESISFALKLPRCGKNFPRDLRKNRPCLNYQMKSCKGWCTGFPPQSDYLSSVQTAVRILNGETKDILSELNGEMMEAAEELRFEIAAEYRNQIRAIEELSNRQHVILSLHSDMDVIGFYRDTKTAFVVIHYLQGQLADKDVEIVSEPTEDDVHALENFILQYYSRRQAIPKMLVLPYSLENIESMGAWLSEQRKNKVELVVPYRGDKKTLSITAQENAKEESIRASSREERQNKTLEMLAKMLKLDSPPVRIEAYDISNTGNIGIVSSMTVFVDGKAKKTAYRKFHMKTVKTQDDFASMKETIERRLKHYLENDEKFKPLPDLILIDGGAGQVKAAKEALDENKISIPIFGMVKDSRHRTDSLVNCAGAEIGIKVNPNVFSLIGNIQEETHRFAITYHRDIRDKRINSELESIPGIGKKRKIILLKHFKSVGAVKKASLTELEHVLPNNTAKEVFLYFHGEEKI